MVDVINITDYSTYVVSGVSPVSKIVATKDGSRIELDSDNDEYSFEIKYYNGTPVEFKDIKEDDVLLVAQSTGAGLNKKEVLLSDVSLTGVLSEISEEYVVIDGQKYSIDSSVLNKAKTGTSYKYLTDAKGRIAYIYALNDVVYGYIYGAMVQSGVGGKILCKIFTENDRWVELAFKNKFKFNGKMINASEVLNPENLGSDFESQRQLVRYNVNSKAEITMMETAKTIARLEPDGVKIHMLCALEGTKVANMYNNGEIIFMNEDEYVSTVCDFLEYLPPQTTIHRLAGNGLRTELVAPRWIGKKLDTLNRIDREFLKRNSKQGSKFIP
jgi:hypothetical protein